MPSATGTLTAPATLTFTYSNNGLEVKKVFTFDSTYVLHVEVTATDHGNPVTAMVAWPSGFGDQETLPDYAASQFDTMQGGKNDNQAAKKISGGAHDTRAFRMGWGERSVVRRNFSSRRAARRPCWLVCMIRSTYPRHGKTDQTDCGLGAGGRDGLDLGPHQLAPLRRS